MPNALTSWKEIAQYLGKGVRTVQRWERMLALPVRRPVGKDRGIVVAYTEELDAWLSSTMACRACDPRFEVDELRALVSDLRADNALLRSELQRLLGNEQPEPQHRGNGDGSSHESLGARDGDEYGNFGCHAKAGPFLEEARRRASAPKQADGKQSRVA
jgi:hypothetical protein